METGEEEPGESPAGTELGMVPTMDFSGFPRESVSPYTVPDHESPLSYWAAQAFWSWNQKSCCLKVMQQNLIEPLEGLGATGHLGEVITPPVRRAGATAPSTQGFLDEYLPAVYLIEDGVSSTNT